MLRREVRDPRLADVTVAAVRVSRGLAHAKIYVTFLDTEEAQVASGMQALSRAAGFLRSALARRVKMRAVPELHFIHDTSVSHGLHLSALIDEAVQHDNRLRQDSAVDEEDD